MLQRSLLLTICLSSAACTVTEPADAPAEPTPAPEQPDPEGTAAPEQGWPVSSRCVEPLHDQCAGGVEAETWDRTGLWAWRPTDDTAVSQLVSPDGEVVTTVETAVWHTHTGLTVRPDGVLVLAGAATGGGEVLVGDASLPLEHSYNRFVLWVSPEGALLDSLLIEGITSEFGVVAARTDDSVVFAGPLYEETSFGDDTWPGPLWVLASVVGVLSPNAEWQWTQQVPAPSEALGDFEFTGLTLGDDSEVLLDGRQRQTVRLGDLELDCGECDARAVLGEDGTPWDLLER